MRCGGILETSASLFLYLGYGSRILYREKRRKL